MNTNNALYQTEKTVSKNFNPLAILGKNLWESIDHCIRLHSSKRIDKSEIHLHNFITGCKYGFDETLWKSAEYFLNKDETNLGENTVYLSRTNKEVDSINENRLKNLNFSIACCNATHTKEVITLYLFHPRF